MVADSTSAADRARVDEQISGLLAESPPAGTPEEEFWGAQFDAGLAWIHFPEGVGALEVAPGLQTVVDSGEVAGQRIGIPEAGRRVIARSILLLSEGKDFCLPEADRTTVGQNRLRSDVGHGQ